MREFTHVLELALHALQFSNQFDIFLLYDCHLVLLVGQFGGCALQLLCLELVLAGVVLDQLENVLVVLSGFLTCRSTVLGGALKYLLRLSQRFLDLLLEHGVLLAKGMYASLGLLLELGVLLLHLR